MVYTALCFLSSGVYKCRSWRATFGDSLSGLSIFLLDRRIQRDHQSLCYPCWIHFEEETSSLEADLELAQGEAVSAHGNRAEEIEDDAGASPEGLELVADRQPTWRPRSLFAERAPDRQTPRRAASLPDLHHSI